MRKKIFRKFMNTSLATLLSCVMLVSPLSTLAMETDAEDTLEMETLTETELDTILEMEDETILETETEAILDDVDAKIPLQTEEASDMETTLESEDETIFITQKETTAPVEDTEDEYTVVIWSEDENGELVPVAEETFPEPAGPLADEVDVNSPIYVNKDTLTSTPGIQTFAGTYTTLTYSGIYKYSYAWDTLALMNKERAKVGASTLTMDKALLDSAMVRAHELAITFSHTRPNGSHWSTAATTTPLHAENIAAEQKTPAQVMNSWMNSAGHRTNILSTSYRSAGVGCFEYEGSYYWVQVFSANSRTNTSRPADRRVTATVSARSSNLVGIIAVKGDGLREGSTFSLPFLVVDLSTEWPAGVLVTPATVTWTSSNTRVATVDANGKITAVGGGTATITATLKNNTNLRDSIPVRVTPLTQIERFVARCYTFILEREYDEDGLHYWSSYLKAGRLTAANVANQMLLSPEFAAKNKTNSAFVDILYRTFMGREPDAGGKNYWTTYLNNGVSRRGVVSRFINSPEFTQISNSYGITKGTLPYTETRDINMNLTMYVYRCYTQTLGRAADIGGLNYWTGRILNGEVSAKAVAESILFSLEFQYKNTSNTEFVKVLYRTYMGREFDQAGLNFWVTRLNSGTSRRDVAASFGNSPEFQAIMRSFGL